ncbi:MAG: MBL fold metallo-hydrolase [Methanobacteriota archaeon]|nr:MAG: MBL fold metallo-hydrolase [Euryarchaeota archaeon]
MKGITKVTCYGGVAEIGGNKILVEDRDSRLWLDMGQSFNFGSEFFAEYLQPRSRHGLRDYFALDLMPRIPGLYSPDALGPTNFAWRDPAFSAILVTHVHSDHVNHLGYVDPSIPVYLGEGTLAILESWGTTSDFVNVGAHDFRPFRTGSSLEIDGVEGEPIHVDHSAPAAYGYLIHTSVGTIAYTGDLRRHGPQRQMTADFIEAAAKARPIALITEGSRVAPEDPRQNLTEAQVKDGAVEIVREAKGKLPLVTFPGRDVDRIRTFAEVAEATGRTFVVDMKTAHLLLTLKGDKRLKIPDIEKSDHVRAYSRQQRPDRWETELSKRLKDRVLTADDIKKRPTEYILQVDFWHLTELIDIEPPEGSPFIHSKSEPFDEEDIADVVLDNWLRRFNLVRHQLHASGHMSEQEIAEMVTKIRPRIVIPVHTQHPDRFARFSRNVVQPVKQQPIDLTG